MRPTSNNACVVGSGPNGLTAAIILAKAGLRTTVFEAQPTIGGGARSAELTLPGFVHDVCSAVHPWAVSSPAFAAFPLAEHGLDWNQPPLPLVHPLDDGASWTRRQSAKPSRNPPNMSRAGRNPSKYGKTRNVPSSRRCPPTTSKCAFGDRKSSGNQ